MMVCKEVLALMGFMATTAGLMASDQTQMDLILSNEQSQDTREPVAGLGEVGIFRDLKNEMDEIKEAVQEMKTTQVHQYNEITKRMESLNEKVDGVVAELSGEIRSLARRFDLVGDKLCDLAAVVEKRALHLEESIVTLAAKK